jgi:hypothetical protein
MLLKNSSRDINAPAIVAPNIGISVNTNVAITVSIAKLEFMTGNVKLSTNTTKPDNIASIPETVNCPETYPVITLYIRPTSFL